ncbi:MAG: DEAD/DEAH box helicase [Nitrospiraceae bacterium]|nr:DEAD/DEAH box helicase [Nitrospiraceae bacterium]
MRFDELDIPAPVLEGIKSAGFAECTPVQELTLPEALKGRDIAAQAQTGTGKTAAFLISVFSRMLSLPAPEQGPSPRALVIAPTRELVVQIDAEARVLAGSSGFTILPVFGGIDYEKQRTELSKGVDMLIGTPGRLIDYLKQQVYSLKKTQFLVIDEADRMFDMGFIADLRFLLRRMAPYDKRQSMLFSATLSHRVMELCYEHMNNPERFSVTPEQMTVDLVEQELYHVGKDEKYGLLLGLLRREPDIHSIIFCNMKSTAERLQNFLNANGYESAALTGDIDQKKRMKILSKFKDGSLSVLVATDVASRGIHVEGVTHVINFDLPQDAEDYVHRIGRTARAGAGGKAISFACEDYVLSMPDIEEYIKQKIPVVPVTDELVVTDYTRVSERRRSKGPQPHDRRRPQKSGRRTSSPQRTGGQQKISEPPKPAQETGKKPKKRRRRNKGTTPPGGTPAAS